MDGAWFDDLRLLLSDRQVDLNVALRLIVDRITQEVGADRGTLYLVDHARGEVVSRVAHLPEIGEIRLQLGEGIAGWVAREGQVVNVPRTHSDERWAKRIDAETGYRTKTLLAVPILDGAVVVGVIQLLNKIDAPTFTDADQVLVERMADKVLDLFGVTSLRSQLVPGHAHPLAFRFNHIIGSSPAMLQVYSLAGRAARTDATVLVRGATGTGKELIARAVHHNSGRRDRPFVKVDCAALPGSLIENELFGHERGAYTGADRETTGKVDAAQGGTLFLDEIGELDLAVQGKLLRLLQDRSYLKVGGNSPIAADLRFVFATHRDLEAEVREGRFRQDLYYRLRVVEIRLPTLRERGPDDIDRLVDHFVYEFGNRHGRPGMALGAAARRALHAHDWPGNVRELEHCIESAVVLSPSDEIGPDALPISGSTPATAGAVFTAPQGTLAEVELAYIRWVLARNDGNRSATARDLDIGRNTLNRKLKGSE